uniref:Ig-like domain-containing protein n=1 Tax=Callorhinchus milii TaxID=7868 RepID=A0A4W3JBI4_CALMI
NVNLRLVTLNHGNILIKKIGHFKHINCQPRLSLTSKLNKTVQIPCIIDSKTLNTDFVHWYRKSADKKLQWILYFQNQQKKEIDSAFKARFFVEKVEQTKSCNLIILDTREADTGVYYCKIFGTGTKLLVTGKNINETDTEFLLVCLITGFYPDVIKVYWKPDGEQSKWETDPVEKENGETSYVISRFNVTQLQWKNSKVICGVQHESSKDNIEVHANGKKTSPKGTVRVSILIMSKTARKLSNCCKTKHKALL